MIGSAKDRFVRLARYNERANREMLEALSLITDKARRRDVGSWFGSIHGILNHVIVSDINWLFRYGALAPDSPVLKDPQLHPASLSWQHDLHDDFEALASHRRAVDGLIRAWFAEFPELRYGELFSYRDSKGAARSAIACDAFDFLFVHQAHHRGQMSQILDTLGVPNNVADNVGFLARDSE